MIINLLKFFLFFGLVVLLSSCSSDNPQDNPEPVICPVVYSYAEGDTWGPSEKTPAARSDFEAISLNDDEKKIIGNRNDFTFKIFRELSKAPENTLFSLMSLSLNLSMLSNGASDATLCELSNISHHDGLSGKLDKKLIDGLLSADKTSRVSIANSIWIDHSLHVLNDFISYNCTNYYAGIFRRELPAKATMDEINAWAEKNTFGIIPSLLGEPLDKDTKMTIANAIYFYGSWVKSFDKKLTHKAKFNHLDGKSSDVDMMVYSESKINYAETDLVHSVSLPFGNEAYRMLFILPKDNTSLDDAIAKLSQDYIRLLDSKASETWRRLSIPKFEISSDLKLREAMWVCGIREMFNHNAPFTRINPNDNLWVDEIIQKTKIEVDEEGAEGAAATLIVMDGSSGNPTSLTFDRPFIFLISEKSSDAILFAGCVKKL